MTSGFEIDIPDDVDRLKILVSDIARRLQNAHYTIEAQRLSLNETLNLSDVFREKLIVCEKKLKLEMQKNKHLEHNKLKDSTFKKYEENKKLSTKFHEDLRTAELDYNISGNKKYVPPSLKKIRMQMNQLELEQNSQRDLLVKLSEYDQLNEELSSSAQNGNIQLCESMISKGALVNYTDAANYIPLHYACANGHYEICKLLLDNGSDATSYLTGQNPIVICATYGHIPIIELLLEFGGTIDDVGKNGSPAIIQAIIHNQLECFEYLLKKGADINQKDSNQNTVLHIAVTSPNAMELIPFLIQRGCQFDRLNKNGLTPYQVALYEKRNDVINLFKQLIDGEDLLTHHE